MWEVTKGSTSYTCAALCAAYWPIEVPRKGLLWPNVTKCVKVKWHSCTPTQCACTPLSPVAGTQTSRHLFAHRVPLPRSVLRNEVKREERADGGGQARVVQVTGKGNWSATCLHIADPLLFLYSFCLPTLAAPQITLIPSFPHSLFFPKHPILTHI